MDENYLASRGKRQIRFAWKIRPVQPKSITQPVYKTSHRQFRERVLAADGSHVFAAIHASLFELLAEPF